MFCKVKERNKRIALRILGPTDSDTLLDMAEEDAQWQISEDEAKRHELDALQPEHAGRYPLPVLLHTSV